MTEWLPYIVLVAMLIYIAYKDEVSRIERKDWIKMIKAQNLEEAAHAEVIEKVEPDAPAPLPDIMPTETLTDDEFIDAVKAAGKQS